MLTPINRTAVSISWDGNRVRHCCCQTSTFGFRILMDRNATGITTSAAITADATGQPDWLRRSPRLRVTWSIPAGPPVRTLGSMAVNYL